MSNLAKPQPTRRAWRRFWMPAVITGVSGTALVVWLDEILSAVEEIIGVLLLPIMAGIIYLLDILMFRSRMPKQEDMNHPSDQGAKKQHDEQ